MITLPACFAVASLALLSTIAEAFVPKAVERRGGAFDSCPSASSRSSGMQRLAMKPKGKDDPAAPSNDEQDQRKQEAGGGFFQAVGTFFEELDAFMDDAS